MPTPQAGIFAEGNSHFFHLEYKQIVQPDSAAIKTALHKLVADNQGAVTVAFGKQLWAVLSPEIQPAQLQDFTPYSGTSPQGMPATQTDLMVWIQAKDLSTAVDIMLSAQNTLAGLFELALRIEGFTYHDSRDLIGFVDGTANPKAEKRLPAAAIPEGKIGAGGSYVLGQKWVHKLNDFAALPVAEQEATVGRTKADDIELEGDEMPANSHVSRTDAKVGDVAQKIWRRSSPYATTEEQGLYFLSFSCELSRFDVQLKRMVGATEDGIYDRLMDYSTAVSGAYWFAPSQEDLVAAFA